MPPSPDMRTWWRYHRVEYGDTLASIARKYHTSPSSIAEANNLSGDEVKVGREADHSRRARANRAARRVAYSHKATHYKVRKGDTVASVADDFEVPARSSRSRRRSAASSSASSAVTSSDGTRPSRPSNGLRASPMPNGQNTNAVDAPRASPITG